MANTGHQREPTGGLSGRAQFTEAVLKYSSSPIGSQNSASYSVASSAVAQTAAASSAHLVSQTTPPAVPLFSPAELHFLKQYAQTHSIPKMQENPYSNLSYSYKPQLLPAYTFLTSSTNAMQNASLLSNYSQATVPQANPYAYPYMAGIAQDDLLYTGPASALFNIPLSYTQNSLNTLKSSSSDGSYSLACNNQVPVNSFMRAQSAQQTERSSARVQVQSSSATSLISHIVVESKPVSASDQKEEEERLLMKKVSPSQSVSSIPRPPSGNYMLHRNAADPSSVQTTTPNAVLKERNQRIKSNQQGQPKTTTEGRLTRPTVGHIYQSPMMKSKSTLVPAMITGIAAPHPPAPIQHANSLNSAPTITQAGEVNYNKPLHPGMTRPPSQQKTKHTRPQTNHISTGYLKNGFKSNPLLGTSLTTSRLKNLNYTPSKPYKDIVNSEGSETADDSSITTSSMRSQTPTMYYRKASKPEEVLQDMRQRPEEVLQDMRPSVEGSARVSYRETQQENDEDRESDPDSERQPGDGQDFQDLEEDDGLDDIDDDDDGTFSDADTDNLSLRSGSGQASQHSLRIHSATRRLLGLTIRDRSASRSRASSVKSRPVSAVSFRSSLADYQAALTPSLFSNIPPTINFVYEGQNESYDWIGYWGKHMKAQAFRSIREYQKVNHFPGSFQIGRKDRLWRNLSRYQVQYGKREFGFFPQTFVLPCDLKLLKRAWEDGGSKQKWIIKPPASARGIGIKVINKWSHIPKKKAVIVQKYLSRPYLINDSKFDLRIYVYVTSYDPLRIYVYEDGLTRFASAKYSHSMKNINNKYMHLTNYSINKKNDDYQANADENACQGHKWTLKTLWQYLKSRGVDTSVVWDSMLDLIVKTIISSNAVLLSHEAAYRSESCVNSLVKANLRRRYCCHELFGFDIMLDDTLKPWIIEVNISPSLHSNSSLDIAVKGGMITDLLNIAGFMVPDKADVHHHPSASNHAKSNYSGVIIDPKLYPAQLCPDEKAKHAYYCQKHNDETVLSTILDTLTPDDVRILTETLNEESRRGGFLRVFPAANTHTYLQYFEQPRYYNLLLDQWIAHFGHMESRGINMLESYCQSGIHLESPTEDPLHHWSPPVPRELRAVSAPSGAAKFSAPSNLPSVKKRKVRTIASTGNIASQTEVGKPHTAGRPDRDAAR